MDSRTSNSLLAKAMDKLRNHPHWLAHEEGAAIYAEIERLQKLSAALEPSKQPSEIDAQFLEAVAAEVCSPKTQADMLAVAARIRRASQPPCEHQAHAAVWHRLVQAIATILEVDGNGSAEQVGAAIADKIRAPQPPRDHSGASLDMVRASQPPFAVGDEVEWRGHSGVVTSIVPRVTVCLNGKHSHDLPIEELRHSLTKSAAP